MDVHLAYPEGYDLQKECIDVSHKHAKSSGGKFTVGHSMEEAFKDADIVYPKSWGSMDLMMKRTHALRAGEAKKVKEIDDEGIAASGKFKGWECTEEKMKTTRGGKALYMHCLPADITDVNCKAGEVAKTVFERYRDPTYSEAEHKLYGMAAMIMNTRFEKPADILLKLLKKGAPRRAV